MDYRERAFKVKFEHAARQLGTAPHQVVSLKLRDNVAGYHEYHELLQVLADEAGVRSTRVEGNLQGTGYVIADSKTKIILVQHETGLEILYIAGSIASLLGLIPLVLKCWSAIRGHIRHPHGGGFGEVEVRKLGEDGKLVEERSHELTAPWTYSFGAVESALLLAAEKIDAELRELRSGLHALTARVVALEGGSSSARRARKPRAGKKRPN